MKYWLYIPEQEMELDWDSEDQTDDEPSVFFSFGGDEDTGWLKYSITSEADLMEDSDHGV